MLQVRFNYKNDRRRTYCIFISSRYSKPFRVIDVYGVDGEHTLVYFSMEILIVTCLKSHNDL